MQTLLRSELGGKNLVYHLTAHIVATDAIRSQEPSEP